MNCFAAFCINAFESKAFFLAQFSKQEYC